MVPDGQNGIVSADSSASLPGVRRLALPAFAITYGVITAVVLESPGEPVTTYAAESTVFAAGYIVAGVGLIAAGVLAWLDRPVDSVGLAGTLAGMAWLAPIWVGWEGGPALPRSLGMVLMPFLIPALAHLALAFPTGRLAGRWLRLLAGGAAMVSLGRALFRDPFLDPYCWSNCTDNLFLIHASPAAARFLDRLWLGSAVVLGLVTAAAVMWRLARATSAGREACGRYSPRLRSRASRKRRTPSRSPSTRPKTRARPRSGACSGYARSH